MKTFAQLKRDFCEGAIIKTVLNNCKPERTGQIRKIVKVQTNAIAFEIPEKDRYRNILGVWQTLSWLYWDKASNYEYDGDTVKCYHTDNGERILDFIYQKIA